MKTQDRRWHFFGGSDPQTSSSLKACDGAWVVGQARDRRDPEVAADWNRPVRREDFDFNFVFARVLRGLGHLEWAAYIHQQHQVWSFANIALDNGAGGGGPEIERRLADTEQDIPTEIRRVAGLDVVTASSRQKVRPIVTRDRHELEGEHLLQLVKRGERFIDRSFPGMTNDKKLVDEVFTAFLGGLRTHIGLPRAFDELGAEEHRGWPQDLIEVLKVFSGLKSQAVGVSVETDDGGNFVFYSGGSRNFIAKGRKDILMAAMYCYLGFVTWADALASGLLLEEGSGETVGDVW